MPGGFQNASELANHGMNACSMTLVRHLVGLTVVTLETHMI